jgi:hypothetical protein
MNVYLTKIWLETPAPGDVIIDDSWYSPGVIGFVATFGVAAAAIALIFDMVRRIRRVRYRAEINEKLDFEEAISSAKVEPKNNADSKAQEKPVRPLPPSKPER